MPRTQTAINLSKLARAPNLFQNSFLQSSINMLCSILLRFFSVSGYKGRLFAPNPRKSMRWTSSPSTDSTVNYKIPTYPVGQRSLDSRHTCRGPPRKEANHCLKQPTNGQSLTFWQLIHFPFPTSSSWRAAGGGETIGIFVIRYRPSIRIARYHSSMLSTMRKRQQSKESQDHQPKSRKTIAFGYSSDKLW